MKRSSLNSSPYDIFKKVGAYFYSPVGSSLLIGLVLVIFSLITSYYIYGYNSDDVVWQSALLTWHPFSGQTFFSDGGVTYIAKLPLFWLITHLLPPGRLALLVTSLVIAIISYVIIFYCFIYILRTLNIRRTRITLLPFIWLSSFGYELTRLFLSPNMHNFEVAVIVLLFCITIALCRGVLLKSRWWVSSLVSLVVGLFIGIMIMDDHYFLYFGVLPAVLVVTLYTIARKASLKVVSIAIGTLVFGFIFEKIIKKLMEISGVQLIDSAGSTLPVVIPHDQLLSKLATSFNDLLTMFGANIFGKGIGSFLFIVVTINLLLLIIVIVKSLKTFKLGISLFSQKGPNAILYPLLGLSVLFWLVIGISTLSSMTPSYRYLVILPFIGIVFLSITLQELSVKKWLVIVIIAATSFNLLSSALSLVRPAYANDPYGTSQSSRDVSQSYNYKLISVLRKNGLHKGFGNYWNGNITTYLSGGNIQLLPIVCINDQVTSLHWLFNQAQFKKPDQNTFYLYDPAYTDPTICPLSTAKQQFGNPTKMIPIEGSTLYIYNYDISTKIIP